MQPTNREEWLTKAIVELTVMFKRHEFAIPPNVKATCGFPSRGALSQRKRTIGQCWDSSQSDSKTFELFISPVLADSVEVLAVLAHECVHATVGTKAGHKGPFKRCALAIGLEGKMTSTVAGAAFKQFAKETLKTIGKYPHAALNPANRLKKQTTRLLKCECEECGYTVRATRVWIDSAGTPICPLDKIAMEVV